MVRLKDRYLLVNIIYTDLPPGQAPTTKANNNNNATVSDLLLYNQPTSNDLRPQLLLRAIRAEVAVLFGDCGAGAVDRSLQVKYLSTATSTFILRVSRAHYRLVWAALAFMGHVPVFGSGASSGNGSSSCSGGRPCVFRVVRVSGTVRKVEEEAVRRARLLVLAARGEMEGGKGGEKGLDALGALLRGGGGSGSGNGRGGQVMGGVEDDEMGMEEEDGFSEDDG
ncbi:Rpp14/Pop5 family-domain-containing protein [Chaetomium sp. MPI-SDFR-AT-0129]|nr:Rpp14/Pop5 family-domain-containing protein [Chaetomium sp. MPI-SDFR-AT-0129]